MASAGDRDRLNFVNKRKTLRLYGILSLEYKQGYTVCVYADNVHGLGPRSRNHFCDTPSQPLVRSFGVC